MKYKTHLTKAECDRLMIYVGHDIEKAERVYELNQDAAAISLKVVSIFERVLRMHIHRHFEQEIGEYWLFIGLGLSSHELAGLRVSIPSEQISPGYLNFIGCVNLEAKRKTEDLIRRSKHEKRLNVSSHDFFVENFELGFWTRLLRKKQETEMDNRGIPLISNSLNNRVVYKSAANPSQDGELELVLKQINKFRNQVCHHEFLLYTKTGKVNPNYVDDTFKEIGRLLRYLGYNETELIGKQRQEWNRLAHEIRKMFP